MALIWTPRSRLVVISVNLFWPLFPHLYIQSNDISSKCAIDKYLAIVATVSGWWILSQLCSVIPQWMPTACQLYQLACLHHLTLGGTLLTPWEKLYDYYTACIFFCNLNSARKLQYTFRIVCLWKCRLRKGVLRSVFGHQESHHIHSLEYASYSLTVI